MPLEVEKFVEHFDEDQGKIETLVRDLTAEDVLQEHIEKMSATRDALFPKVEKNTKAAQEKQKQQYLKRKGCFDCSFKNGDTVLRRNMLEKTKKGHKMEGHWNGPYTAEELDLKKGTCRLRGKHGTLLQRRVNVKECLTQNVQDTIQLSAASTPTIAAVCNIIPALHTIKSGSTSTAGITTPAGSTTKEGSSTPEDSTSSVAGTISAASTSPTGRTMQAASTSPAASGCLENPNSEGRIVANSPE